MAKKKKRYIAPDPVLSHQEKEHPTEPYEVKVTNEKTVTRTRRRKQDARLFDDLDSYHQQAMEEILDGWNYATNGIGVKVMQWKRFEERHRGKFPLTSRGEDMRTNFVDWATRGREREFHLRGAIEIIVFGWSLNKTDKFFKKRNGWAKWNLLDALNSYCKLRGFK